MIPTPDVGHVTRAPYVGKVYEPAEDSFALLDALEQDTVVLQQAQPRLVVEIGAGSGCISAFLAQIIGPTEAAFVCTDINELALHATRQTGLRNGNTHLDVIQSSLLHALWPRCRAQVDVLLFNPPYVPTTEEEETVAQRLASIQGSWAGGALGTTLVEQILPLVPLILAPKGRFYFVAIKQNDPDELVQRLIGLGLKADVCLSRRAGLEHLFILRAIRSE